MASRRTFRESASSDLVIIENEIEDAGTASAQSSRLRKNAHVLDASVPDVKGGLLCDDATVKVRNAKAGKRNKGRRKATQRSSDTSPKIESSPDHLSHEKLGVSYQSKRKLPSGIRQGSAKRRISEPSCGDKQGPKNSDVAPPGSKRTGVATRGRSILEQVHCNTPGNNTYKQMVHLTDELFELKNRLEMKDCGSREVLDELRAESYRIESVFASMCRNPGSASSRAFPDEICVFSGRLDYVREKIGYFSDKLPRSGCTVDGDVSVLRSKMSVLRQRFSDLNREIGELARGDDVLRLKLTDFSKHLDVLDDEISTLEGRAALSGGNGMLLNQSSLGEFLDGVKLKIVYLYGQISCLNEGRARLGSPFHDTFSSFETGPAKDVCDGSSSESHDLVVLTSEVEPEETVTGEPASAVGSRSSFPQCERPLSETKARIQGPLAESDFDRGENVSTESTPASSYKIIFKKGSYSKQWILGADDSVEVLYDDIFGKGSTRIICLEGLLVSRHLSVSENGFFPGTNYVTLPEDDKEGVKAFSEAVVQTDGHPRNNFRVQFSSDMTVRDVLARIMEIRCMDSDNPQMVFNGLPLGPDQVFSDAVEDGDVVDVIQSCVGPTADVQ